MIKEYHINFSAEIVFKRKIRCSPLFLLFKKSKLYLIFYRKACKACLKKKELNKQRKICFERTFL